jgi:hypothetical protein
MMNRNKPGREFSSARSFYAFLKLFVLAVKYFFQWAIAAVKIAVATLPYLPLLRILEYEENFSFFRQSLAGYCHFAVGQVKRTDSKRTCSSVRHQPALLFLFFRPP